MRISASIAVALAIALSAGIAGCKKRYIPPPPPPPPAPMAKAPVPRPLIADFSSRQAAIARGDSVVLAWHIENATSATIEPGIGPVPPAGRITISPDTTTTYTLTAVGPGGSEIRRLTIEVYQPSAVPIETLPPPTIEPEPTIVRQSAGRSPASASDASAPVSRTPQTDIRRLVLLRPSEPAIPADRMTALDKQLSALPTGAFLFAAPESPQPGATVRLFVDTNPLFVSSQDALQRALADPGVQQGEPVKVAGSMCADLTGTNVRIRRVFPRPVSGNERPCGSTGEDPAQVSPSPVSEETRRSGSMGVNPIFALPRGEQDLSSSRPAQWIWQIEVTGEGSPELILDLQARLPGGGEWVSVQPPITHTWDKPPPPPEKPKPGDVMVSVPAPSASWTNVSLFALILVLVAATASAVTFAVMRARAVRPPPAQPAATAAPAPLPPPGPALKTRVVVIHGRDERVQAERFCEGLNATRCEFIYALPGFAEDSLEWRRHFLDGHANADAVLVLLTGAALLESGFGWQVEQVMSQQGLKQLPVYPVVLDPQVTRAASTLARLSDRAWFKGAAPEDVSEVGEILNSLEPSILRSIECFLSYSRKDAVELADRLWTDLDNRGIRCWRDTADIPGGAEWERQIAAAIEKSTHVLFLISPKSLESPHVVDEVTYARERAKVVIPLLSVDLPLPFGFHRIQAIPLYLGYEAGFERLVRDLTTPRAQAQTG